MAEPQHEVDIFTVGQVARIAGVSTRLVAMWIDAGLLPGFRLPGSKDRRVVREELQQFLAENGMVDRRFELRPTALAVGVTGPDADALAALETVRVDFAADAFEAGGACTRYRHSVCVLDLSLPGGRDLAARLPGELLLLAAEDGPPGWATAGMTVLQRPFHPRQAAAWVKANARVPRVTNRPPKPRVKGADQCPST